MAKRAPKLIALDPDDHDAKYVGCTKDGRQFFLTFPFSLKRGFIALYIFEKDGQLLEARIEDLGPRAHADENSVAALRDDWLADLGGAASDRIVVAPFRVQRFGEEFGFIARPPQEPGDEWSVTVEPGDYMAFSPPWKSGRYDT